jgi:ATP-binding cassette subfamily B (MDR/TAP) protein 1
VGEQRTSVNYSKALEPTVSLGRQIGFIKGLATGSSGITFAIWALMAWYGSRLIINDGVQGGKVTSAGIVALMGGL